MVKVSEAIGALLQARKTDANADLVARWSVAQETQVNVAADGGEPVAGKRSTYSDGVRSWHSFRVPHRSDSEPTWEDYPLSFSIAEHAEAIGMTGWDWQARRSRWVAFDFDDLTHGKGLTADELERVKQAAGQLPYIETRRSTGGGGIHLYADFAAAGIPCENHTIHAALARAILGKMSKDVGFDFASRIDCCGGNMWIWARKMTPENQGLARIKAATLTLTEADLPADWRNAVKPKKESPKPTPKPTHPVDDDFLRTSDFGFLVEAGWTKNGEHFRRPGTDKDVSASIVTAEDGARLLHVFTNRAPPLIEKQNYNAFTAYTLLNHGGDEEAARAALAKLGYGRFRIPTLTCQELDTGHYDLDYLVENVYVAAQPCIFAGQSKTLKTSCAIDFAISVVTGKPFLGVMQVLRRCPVAMLSGESGRGTLRETARRICRSKGLTLSDISDLVWSDQIPNLNEPHHLAALERLIQETGCKVLIIDPTYLAMPGGDPGNLFSQGERLRQPSELCQQHGVGLILLTHCRKRGKTKYQSDFDPPELDDISYSGFGEFARQWFLLGRRETYTSGSGDHKLWLNLGGSAGHGALWAVDITEGESGTPRRWEVTLSRPDEARADKKTHTLRQKLVDALREFPSGQTKTAILQTAKLKNEASTRIIFDALVNDGTFVACIIKTNGVGYPGFCLAGSNPQDA